MHLTEREFLVSSIRNGIIFYKDWVILPFSIQDIALSYEEYYSMYEECVAEGIETESDMKKLFAQQGIWTTVHEKQLENVNKEIDEIKLDMYKNRSYKDSLKSFRSKLSSKRKTLNYLNNEKAKIVSNTCESLSESHRLKWLISQSVRSKTGSKNNKDYAIQDLVFAYTNSFLEENDIREIARNEPWRLSWYLIKSKSVFRRFKNRDLTVNQKNLLFWSKVYDNVNESPDSPKEDVIADDDLLDGWFLHQKEKREKTDLENEILSKSKPNKKGEVFVIAETEEDVKRINSLNNPIAQQQAQSRVDFLNKNDGKKFEWKDLPDVKQAIQTQALLAQKNGRKNG